MNDTDKMVNKFLNGVEGVEAFHSLPEDIQQQIINNGGKMIKTGINLVNKVTEFIS